MNEYFEAVYEKIVKSFWRRDWLGVPFAYYWRRRRFPWVNEYSSRGDEVRKSSFLTVIKIKYKSFSMEAWSNFIMEEWASFLKRSLKAEMAMGSCGMSKVCTKCCLKMAAVSSWMILDAAWGRKYIFQEGCPEPEVCSWGWTSCGSRGWCKESWRRGRTHKAFKY